MSPDEFVNLCTDVQVTINRQEAVLVAMMRSPLNAEINASLSSSVLPRVADSGGRRAGWWRGAVLSVAPRMATAPFMVTRSPSPEKGSRVWSIIRRSDAAAAPSNLPAIGAEHLRARCRARPLDGYGAAWSGAGTTVSSGRRAFHGPRLVDASMNGSASPAGTIEIVYGRPLKRGRDLFGTDDFVEFLNDVVPGVARRRERLDAPHHRSRPAVRSHDRSTRGYTIFIELSRQRWTFIVSSWRAQTAGYDTSDKTAWQRFDYTPDKDLVRVPMTIETLPHAHDQLHWEFLDMTATGGRLAIMWDRQMASVPFSVGSQ